jgi:hypothetical protein
MERPVKIWIGDNDWEDAKVIEDLKKEGSE